jgi:uncharacterized protein YjbI with pentapeptide repeats
MVELLFARTTDGDRLTRRIRGLARLGANNLRQTNLSRAVAIRTMLDFADLTDATLTDADFGWATIRNATIVGAVSRGTGFHGANLTGTRFDDATVYGISAWDVEIDDETSQKRLKVSPRDQPDDLEVAQFLYLLLNRQKLRNVLNAAFAAVDAFSRQDATGSLRQARRAGTRRDRAP